MIFPSRSAALAEGAAGKNDDEREKAIEEFV